jgi:hypothetical protein
MRASVIMTIASIVRTLSNRGAIVYTAAQFYPGLALGAAIDRFLQETARCE